MKKLFVFLIILVVSCSFIFAQGKTEVTEEASTSSTIKFITYGGYHDALTAVVEAFEKSHPGVTVEMEEFPFNQLFDAIEIKMGSKDDNYDVILTDAPMLTGYAYNGFIAPMEEYMTEEEMNSFTDALKDSSMYDGKFYAPPLKNSCAIVWYNKDILDKTGIPYPSSEYEDRMTWSEFSDICIKVRNANDPSVYGFTFEQISRPYQVLVLPNSLRAEGIGPDGITVDGFVNSPEFIESMQWYQDIHNKLDISPKGVAPAETQALFTAGKLCFLAGNMFDYKTFENTPDLNYGYMPLPYFENGTPVTPTDSWHVGLSNYSKNKELAAEFIKYLTLYEGNDIYLDVQGDFGARKDVLNNYLVDDNFSEFPKTSFRLAAKEAMNTAKPRPLILGYREWESIMTSTMEDIRNNAPVKEALDNAVNSIAAQLAIYK